ncbi:MAG: DNA-processing protein DprA [Metamycoplasmataceae bacterium]
MKYILIFFAIKYKGNFEKIYKALKDKEFVSIEEIEKIYDKIKNKEIQAITILDDEYPAGLKEIYKPPFVLFYKGNKELLKVNAITITGENKIGDIESVKASIYKLSNDNALVTNYYRGLDEEIVNSFIEQDRPIIFISANGLKNGYFINDIDHIKNKLVLSEICENEHVNKERLIGRNRIVAGIANALIILNSKSNSGLMNLVSFFLENGKEIYCHSINDKNSEDINFSGNKVLIDEGASVFENIDEISIFKNNKVLN